MFGSTQPDHAIFPRGYANPKTVAGRQRIVRREFPDMLTRFPDPEKIFPVCSIREFAA
jgi:hypothetical protein